MKDVREIGKRLARLMRTRDGERLLGSLSGWDSGGCWILAESVRRVVGGSLWVVSTDTHVTEHVVVKAGNYFIDIDGARTEGEVLAAWRQRWMWGAHTNPYLQPFTTTMKLWAEKDANIPCPIDRVDRVTSFLKRKLRLT